MNPDEQINAPGESPKDSTVKVKFKYRGATFSEELASFSEIRGLVPGMNVVPGVTDQFEEGGSSYSNGGATR